MGVKLVVIGCALCAAALAVWYFRPARDTLNVVSAGELDAAHAEIAALNTKLERLGHRVEGVSRAVVMRDAKVTSTPAQTAVTSEKRERPSFEERRLLAQVEREQNGLGLARLFSAETRDAAWAPAFEQELTASLAEAAGERGTVTRVECKSSMCRASLDFDSEDRRNEVTQELAERPELATETYYFPSLEGASRRLTFYTARAGQRITPALQKLRGATASRDAVPH